MVVLWVVMVYEACGMSYDEKLKKFDKVRIDERNFAKIHNIHVNWYGTSIKAIMGQLGKSLFKELDDDDRRALARCLDKIEDRKDLEESAKCLVRSRKSSLSKKRKRTEEDSGEEWVGGFRQDDSNGVTKRKAFREVLGQQTSKEANVTKIPRIALLRRRVVNGIRKSQRRGNRRKRSSRWTRFGDLDNEPDNTLKVRNVTKSGGLRGAKERSPVSRVADLISMIAMGNVTVDEAAKTKAVEWKQTYDRLLNLKKVFEKKEEEPGARIYSMRMYDIVLDRKTPTMSPKESRTPQGLIQMAMTLFNQLGGDKNREMRESMNTNVLSPRFAPVMRDKARSTNMNLSPTILSFYEDEENKNNIASIPKLLKSAGVEGKDREVMLGALMKASGATDVVNDAINFLDGINFFGKFLTCFRKCMKDEVFEVTERVAGVYEELEASFHQRQHDSLEKEGFTFMDDKQLEQLYNSEKLSLPDKAKSLNNLKNTTIAQKMEALWLTIEQIASGKSFVSCKTNA
uniref:DNA-directed RNA polymerase n=1 Tax=Bursaphelenchus xylophilus TaxID=6326 RepID=A0A1I7RW18_BURXY